MDFEKYLKFVKMYIMLWNKFSLERQDAPEQ